MGNNFAYAILILWPLMAVYWYRTKTIQTATLWTILGGFMFLPVKTAFDFPMIPAMGKHTVPVVSALIGCWLIKKQPISYFKDLGNIKYLVILFVMVPFITASLNGTAIITEGRYLPRLTYYDGLSAVINQFLLVAPFFIGRHLFRTHADHVLMFKTLAVAGLIYSIPMLFEVRMSPQLHTWIYGYFPHSFAQTFRAGGFRPVVFMGHGLLVAFFTVTILISALALWNNRIKIGRFSAKNISYYFFILLVLCKSYASLFYGVFAFLVVKKIKPKTQHLFAVILVCLAMLYPLMSIMKTFPHDTIVNIAASVNEERAGSLQFRFDHETILLERARERLFFGWGGWGRSRIYDEKTGKDLSVTDGGWIITLGQFGIFGFIAEFGLLAIVVFRARKAAKYLKSKPEKTLFAAHAILVGLIMIDQLPNSSLAPWLWLLTGILLGRSEAVIFSYKEKELHR